MLGAMVTAAVVVVVVVAVAMAVVTQGVMVEVVVGVEVLQGPRKPVLGTGPAPTATTSALLAGWLHFASAEMCVRSDIIQLL